jgi:hypothetical protein
MDPTKDDTSSSTPTGRASPQPQPQKAAQPASAPPTAQPTGLADGARVRQKSTNAVGTVQEHPPQQGTPKGTPGLSAPKGSTYVLFDGKGAAELVRDDDLANE